MNENVRSTLCHMVQQHGRSLADDPRRCEGLLRDLCPRDRQEIHVLVNAAREGVPAELRRPVTAAAPAAAIERLAQKLQQNLGLAPEAARWAVESWALALEVVSAEALRNSQKKAAAGNPPGVNPYSTADFMREMSERQEKMAKTPVSPPAVPPPPVSPPPVADTHPPQTSDDRFQHVGGGLLGLLLFGTALIGFVVELIRGHVPNAPWIGIVVTLVVLLAIVGLCIYGILKGLFGR